MLLVFVLSVVGAFIQRTIGFGFGIFIMTLLPQLLPSYGEATALSGLLAMTTSLVITVRYWHLISWSSLLPVLLVFGLVSTVAIELLPFVSDKCWRQIVGVVLLLLVVYFMTVKRRLRLTPSRGLQFLAGCGSGVMGGLFAMPGPPVVIYFVTSAPSKKHYLAITSAFFLFGNLAMAIVRCRAGFITADVVEGVMIGLPGVVLGTWLGSILFARLSETLLQRIVYAYIAMSGLIALLSA